MEGKRDEFGMKTKLNENENDGWTEEGCDGREGTGRDIREGKEVGRRGKRIRKKIKEEAERRDGDGRGGDEIDRREGI